MRTNKSNVHGLILYIVTIHDLLVRLVVKSIHTNIIFNVVVYFTTSLKTDLCDNGCSRLINIDHKLIMLDQLLGRAVSHDRAKIDSELFKLSEKQLIWCTLINVDQGIIKNPPAQLINLN